MKPAAKVQATEIAIAQFSSQRFPRLVLDTDIPRQGSESSRSGSIGNVAVFQNLKASGFTSEIHWTPEMDMQVLRRRFDKLRARWEEEVRFVSSSTDRIMNMNFQRIIGLGKDAVPFILDALREGTGDWAWALTAIVQPTVSTSAGIRAGDLVQLRGAWLQWGRENGYVV